MEDNNHLERVLGPFTLQELKNICKENGLRGYSKYKKADLVNFILVSLDEKKLKDLTLKTVLPRISRMMDDAVALLNGETVNLEKIQYASIESTSRGEKEIVLDFEGTRWSVRCLAVEEGLKQPFPDFNCDCRNGRDGYLCIHGCTIILLACMKGLVNTDCLDVISSKMKDVLEEKLASIQEEKVNEIIKNNDQDKDIPFEELLSRFTSASRLKRAKEELGRVPGSEKILEPIFSLKKDDPNVEILVDFKRKDDGTWKKSSLRIFISISRGILAHEGCMDFTMRVMKKNQLCKHLVATLLELEEPISRSILTKIPRLRFASEIPADVGTYMEKSELEGVKADFHLVDADELKDAILAYLVEHEDDDDDEALSIQSIEAALKTRVAEPLAIMVQEGIVEEFKPGHFSLKK